ncbi:hypothetical protein KQH90_02030 [Anaerosalibacter bizertensis]|uniref:terminase TerL endonuclease subunit n=1 Tax=Anaerosalibacter bizertensis TaxID=932217 RepID=UPI001C0E954E|nr:terminase TerL endonuclease subunit [Anaerosalibacter bizertensis]MBU5292816.1 hypothetical protein [Anaerosalibacter bizertensis]
MAKSCYKYHEYIDGYLNAIKNNEVIVGKYIKKLPSLVEKELNKDNVFIDSDKIYDTKRVIEEHSDITLFDWQLFVIGLMHCYYTDIPAVVFPEILLYMGRGAGKNKFIAELSRYFSSPNYGVPRYNIDITANNETQAKISFMDFHGSLEANESKMKKIYHWNLMEIVCKITGSKVKYHTSNARTKDGLRPGMVVFDEIHEYENYDTINVFTSALGKVPHDRTIYITTNGYVRGGVLDKELQKARDVLDGKEESMGFLPLLYELDDDKEVHDEKMWNKANPSLKYLPGLKNRIQREYRNSKRDSNVLIELMTKRMNRPRQKNYTPVAEWKKIKATNKPIPYTELEGLSCIGGVDYSSIRDFCSVGLLFKHSGKRYWLEHTFVNKKALEIPSREIKFPVMEMADKGLITIVRDETIRPETVSDWFLEKAQRYNIINIAADMHRATYLKQEFDDVGLPLEIVRSGPITHSKLSPLIESIFAEETLIWGDNPTMNWYTNNTYQEFDKKGNISYKKIEPELRKTDGFFALIHALVLDGELKEEGKPLFLNTITF